MHIRTMTPKDVPSVLSLMQGLADFEQYRSEFRVSEADLNERGFGENPQFEVTLAEDASRGDLLGMAVHYQIEFTYDLKPDLVLKELFVAEAARGQGVGAALMRELNRIAGRRGCGRIKWLVMRGNDVARQFYRSLGAKQDLKWENWFMTVDPGLEG